MSDPRPCSAPEAVARALSMVGVPMPYILGTGDYHGGDDAPWTMRDGVLGSDCAGFAISWCYKLPRHRPGYNVGAWASVSDDLNCNSAIEDSEHAHELFAPVTDAPRPGDLIAYPTIHLAGHTFIGHVCIVVGVERAGFFTIEAPDFSLLDVVHCHGPNGRAPACTRADGSIWNQHSAVWPKPEHRSRVLRVQS